MSHATEVVVGLYKRTLCFGYDDDDDDSEDYTVLLGVDRDSESLINRWNTWQDAARQKIKDAKKHVSYLQKVPPNFQAGCLSLEYSGNTGGGWRTVKHIITIKPIPQFDHP